MTFNSAIFDVLQSETEEFFSDCAEHDQFATQDFREPDDADDDSEADDEEDFEDFDDILGNASTLFGPPSPKDWIPTPFDEIPDVKVDGARLKAWEVGKNEIKFIQKKIKKLGRSKFNNTDYVEVAAQLLGGPDSNLYHV